MIADVHDSNDSNDDEDGAVIVTITYIIMKHIIKWYK